MFHIKFSNNSLPGGIKGCDFDISRPMKYTGKSLAEVYTINYRNKLGRIWPAEESHPRDLLLMHKIFLLLTCFFFIDLRAFLSPLSRVCLRALIVSAVHWIWLDVIHVWPGKSLSHLSLLDFFRAALVTDNLSIRVFTIALSTSPNQF